MCRVLIVDDEEIILEGLKRNIHWKENGFEIVGQASNGEKGLALVRELQPDIIISDVRMPVLDGLDMVEQVGLEYPWIKTILLTGYDNFAYAKRALNLKVTNYVLKYNYKEEILAAAIQAREELKLEARLKEQAKKGRGLMERRMIKDLINGRIGDFRERLSLNNFEISFVSDRFIVATLGFSPLEGGRSSKETLDLDEATILVQDLCERAVENSGNQVYCTEFQQNIVVCFNLNIGSEGEGLVYGILADVLNGVSAVYPLRGWVGIGGLVTGIENIKHSYEESQTALEVARILNKQAIMRFTELNGNEHSSQVILNKITDYIENNYFRKELSLNSISKEVYISPAYISTLFKKSKGINLSEYIIKVRLEKAVALLKNTDLKSYEIAEKIGYTSAQYFSVLFKKYFGCSPTEYKNKIMQ